MITHESGQHRWADVPGSAVGHGSGDGSGVLMEGLEACACGAARMWYRLCDGTTLYGETEIAVYDDDGTLLGTMAGPWTDGH